MDPQPSNATEQILKAVTQDLRSLQQEVVTQMGQDISRLQAERSRLLNDIEKLQAQNHALQSEHQILLSQQQLAQQKVWAKQLAQALASQLYAILSQRLKQNETSHMQASGQLPSLTDGQQQGTNQAMMALDNTINQALVALQQDLSTYEQALAQRLERMQGLEKQGEALLDELVSRLSDRLQVELAKNPAEASPFPTGSYPQLQQAQSASGVPSGRSLGSTQGLLQGTPSAAQPDTPSASNIPTAPVSASRASRAAASRASQPESGKPAVSAKRTPAQLGLILILLSTLALSLHNVVVGMIGWETRLFGVFSFPVSLELDSFSDSLLILWLRMVVVVPVMWFVARWLYPPVWRDVKTFFLSRDLRPILTVIGSGLFLFSSQVLIYLAIAAISPGVAVTILFMYPLITVPLAWFLFGDRPTFLRWIVMFAILCGVVLTALPRLAGTTTVSVSGIVAAIFSGVFFALYLISMQISFKKLHPVPVSFIQFVTIFVLANLMLIPFGVQQPPRNLAGLLLGGLVLGTLTLIGYLLNNLGVQRLGAARASIIASSGPVLTALLAFLITPGPITALKTVQIMGILLVTLGVIGLSFERMIMQNKPAKPAR
ncbi:EamA family transporter [Leptolyngbya sp. AN02str]|uniref:EamA family transporter n=1 Tax=Leptolyngbya sp. AN02str TaxID=3423363 RepID=UPI003D31F380